MCSCGDCALVGFGAAGRVDSVQGPTSRERDSVGQAIVCSGGATAERLLTVYFPGALYLVCSRRLCPTSHSYILITKVLTMAVTVAL